MEESNTTVEEAAPPTRELVRPREGRMIVGVAQGLANRYDVPVLLLRVAVVLLIFAGGLGVALYAAGWFLIRAEDEPQSPAKQLLSGDRPGRSWVGVILVFVAAMILLDNFTFLSGGTIWAVGLLVVGILLYTGDLQRLGKPTEDIGERRTAMASTGQAIAPDRGTEVTSGDQPGGPPPTATPAPPIVPPRATPPRERSLLGRLTIGVMLVALGLLAILDNIPTLPLQAQPRHYMALAVTVLGLGLIVGGFMGRARWLIIVAALMVPTLLFSPAFEYDWNSEAFDRIEIPDTFGQLQDSYDLEVGNLVIDLTELPWDGETVELDVVVDAGNIRIVIPQDVGLVGEASVDVGRVGGLGRESAGLGNPTIQFDQPGPEGTVDLSATVDVGNIDIVHVGN